MPLPSNLARLLALPTALTLAACDAGSRVKDTQAAAAAPNACAPKAEAKQRYEVACAPDDLKKHEGRTDGHKCYFDSCALPVSGTCPEGFEPAVRSQAPASTVCWIWNPVEL